MIGLRTTHLRSRDGRHVTVPNSIIGASQIVNYAFPETAIRTQIEFETYGSNIDRIQQVIEDAIRGIEGVLVDRSTDVFHMALGGDNRQIRVRWWVDHINHRTRVQDRVTRAIEQALDAIGVDTSAWHTM